MFIIFRCEKYVVEKISLYVLLFLFYFHALNGLTDSSEQLLLVTEYNYADSAKFETIYSNVKLKVDELGVVKFIQQKKRNEEDRLLESLIVEPEHSLHLEEIRYLTIREIQEIVQGCCKKSIQGPPGPSGKTGVQGARGL